MKKYIISSVLLSLFLSSCTKSYTCKCRIETVGFVTVLSNLDDLSNDPSNLVSSFSFLLGANSVTTIDGSKKKAKEECRARQMYAKDLDPDATFNTEITTCDLILQ